MRRRKEWTFRGTRKCRRAQERAMHRRRIPGPGLHMQAVHGFNPATVAVEQHLELVAQKLSVGMQGRPVAVQRHYQCQALPHMAGFPGYGRCASKYVQRAILGHSARGATAFDA